MSTSCLPYKDIHCDKIEGYVVDQNKNPVSDAVVSFVLEEFSGSGDTTVTDKNGYYTFKQVSSIEIERIGGCWVGLDNHIDLL